MTTPCSIGSTATRYRLSRRGRRGGWRKRDEHGEAEQHVDVIAVPRQRQDQPLDRRHRAVLVVDRRAAVEAGLAARYRRHELAIARRCGEARVHVVEPLRRRIAAERLDMLGSDQAVFEAQWMAFELDQPEPGQQP